MYLSFVLFHQFQGHIFAADNKYYGYMIPTIAHSVVINILNKLYRTVAHFCTDMENHRYGLCVFVCFQESVQESARVLV